MNIDIAAETLKYNRTLQDFITAKKLARYMFNPIDHIAFKAYSTEHYNMLLGQLKSQSGPIHEVWMDERRIATAKLLGEHSVVLAERHGVPIDTVEYVELMEARPNAQSTWPPRLDHAEFVHPSIEVVRQELSARGIRPVDQDNDAHSWLSIQIGDNGEEAKFSEKSLKDIVAEQEGSRFSRRIQ